MGCLESFNVGEESPLDAAEARFGESGFPNNLQMATLKAKQIDLGA